jgi:hypothetical protein
MLRAQGKPKTKMINIPKTSAMENKISVVIPADTIQSAITDIQSARNKMAQYLHQLTPNDREQLPKMRTKNTGKVKAILNEMNVSPEYAPPMFDVQEVAKDVNAVDALSPLATEVLALFEMVDDTITLCGSEAYMAATDYYGMVKRAAQRNDPKAAAIFERMKPLFASQGNKASKPDNK